MDVAEPKRQKPRKEMELPMAIVSNMEREEPNLHNPNTDTVDPQRMKLRKLIEDAMHA
jgi:hypothetical protein